MYGGDGGEETLLYYCFYWQEESLFLGTAILEKVRNIFRKLGSNFIFLLVF